MSTAAKSARSTRMLYLDDSGAISFNHSSGAVHYVDSMTSEPTQAADLISAARRRTIEGTPGMHERRRRQYPRAEARPLTVRRGTGLRSRRLVPLVSSILPSALSRSFRPGSGHAEISVGFCVAKPHKTHREIWRQRIWR